MGTKYSPERATWIVTCETVFVALDQMTITLSMHGFDELQTTLIHPTMPTWILRTGTSFQAKIPRACIRERSLLTVEWGGFRRFIDDYAGLEEDEHDDIDYWWTRDFYEESMGAQ